MNVEPARHLAVFPRMSLPNTPKDSSFSYLEVEIFAVDGPVNSSVYFRSNCRTQHEQSMRLTVAF
jgi:hypothetical protein